MDIDFVVTWVNMDDPEWQNEFSKYSGNKDNTKNGVSKARFRHLFIICLKPYPRFILL